MSGRGKKEIKDKNILFYFLDAIRPPTTKNKIIIVGLTWHKKTATFRKCYINVTQVNRVLLVRSREGVDEKSIKEELSRLCSASAIPFSDVTIKKCEQPKSFWFESQLENGSLAGSGLNGKTDCYYQVEYGAQYNVLNFETPYMTFDELSKDSQPVVKTEGETPVVKMEVDNDQSWQEYCVSNPILYIFGRNEDLITQFLLSRNLMGMGWTIAENVKEPVKYTPKPGTKISPSLMKPKKHKEWFVARSSQITRDGIEGRLKAVKGGTPQLPVLKLCCLRTIPLQRYKPERVMQLGAISVYNKLLDLNNGALTELENEGDRFKIWTSQWLNFTSGNNSLDESAFDSENVIRDESSNEANYDYFMQNSADGLNLEMPKPLSVPFEDMQADDCLRDIEQKERKMIEDFITFFHETEPDLLLGYNLTKKDGDLLIGRMQYYEINKSLSYNDLLCFQNHNIKTSNLNKLLNGRPIVDVRKLCFDNNINSVGVASEGKLVYKRNDLSLSEIASIYLQQPELAQKLSQRQNVALNYQWFLTENTMKQMEELLQLEMSCCYAICEKAQFLNLMLEINQLTGCPLTRLFVCGRSEITEWFLMFKFLEHHWVLPEPKKILGKHKKSGEPGVYKRANAFEGGRVKEPPRGVLEHFMLEVDINSMYPAVIGRSEICFCFPEGRRVEKIMANSEVEDIKFLQEDEMDDYRKKFKEELLLPRLMKQLIEEREISKKLTKSPGDRHAVRSLALKLTANGTYGSLGMESCRFFMRVLSSNTAMFSRFVIMQVESHVEKNLGLIVHYVDTDGLKIDTKISSSLSPELAQTGDFEALALDYNNRYEEVCALGVKAVQEINQIVLNNEMGIKLEGISRSSVFMSKKMFSSIVAKRFSAEDIESLWNGKEELLDIGLREDSGIPVVNRDFPNIAKICYHIVLDMILRNPFGITNLNILADRINMLIKYCKYKLFQTKASRLEWDIVDLTTTEPAVGHFSEEEALLFHMDYLIPKNYRTMLIEAFENEENYIIYTRLSRNIDLYNGNRKQPPHVWALKWLLSETDFIYGSNSVSDEVVPFIMCTGGLACHPARYWLEYPQHEIDYCYYYRQQILEPLERLCALVPGLSNLIQK